MSEQLVIPEWVKRRTQPNKDGTPAWARWFRLTRARIAAQAFFLALFVFLFWHAWTSRLGGYPASLFLEVDPLVGAATALSTHRLYRWLYRGLFVLVPTLLLGRAFCNWMCPFGTIHQITGWLFNTFTNRLNIDRNRYRPSAQLKYILLGVTLVMAALGSLQIGLLDPICLLTRTFATALAPAWDLGQQGFAVTLRDRLGMDPEPWLLGSTAPGSGEARIFTGAWFVGLFFVGLVGMNLVIPRFFCRVLCPLGAALGLLSRWAPVRIHRDLTKCTDCDLCLRRCEGASDPQGALRKSECFVCLNCIDDCPEDALSFGLAPLPVRPLVVGAPSGMPRPAALAAKAPAPQPAPTVFGVPLTSALLDTVRESPQIPRRRVFLTAVGGLLAYPFLRLSAAVNKRGFSPKAIRPPGSVEESAFLERCIKCDACIRVCPTNVLQPATLEPAGLEGLWTPVMNFSVGFCQLNCTLCSEVCPTGAIQKTTQAKKLGLGPHQSTGPISVGTAFIDRGRCLPWAMETPCVVCEEVCPVSPKAIGAELETRLRWDGKTVALKKPVVRPELCIGCGICQHECPVLDQPAVYVTAIGETRSKERSLLLGGGSQGGDR